MPKIFGEYGDQFVLYSNVEARQVRDWFESIIDMDPIRLIPAKTVGKGEQPTLVTGIAKTDERDAPLRQLARQWLDFFDHGGGQRPPPGHPVWAAMRASPLGSQPEALPLYGNARMLGGVEEIAGIMEDILQSGPQAYVRDMLYRIAMASPFQDVVEFSPTTGRFTPVAGSYVKRLELVQPAEVEPEEVPGVAVPDEEEAPPLVTDLFPTDADYQSWLADFRVVVDRAVALEDRPGAECQERVRDIRERGQTGQSLLLDIEAGGLSREGINAEVFAFPTDLAERIDMLEEDCPLRRGLSKGAKVAIGASVAGAIYGIYRLVR